MRFNSERETHWDRGWFSYFSLALIALALGSDGL